MLHAFDLDHTLLNCNASFRFYRFLLSKKFYPLSSLFASISLFLRYKFFKMDLTNFHLKAFQTFLKGFSEIDLYELSKQFTEIYWEKMQYSPAVDYLKKAKQNGHLTLILSSSPHFLVEAIANKFQVTACQGTQYEFNQERHFYKIDSLVIGSNKAQFMYNFAKQYHISTSDIIAYSDSISDLPFLESAGIAIGVNPDFKLKRICQQRKWQIL